MKGLSCHQVNCLARRHRAEHCAKCLDAWSHLVSMVSAQLPGSPMEIDRPGIAYAMAKTRQLEREGYAALQPPLPLATDFPGRVVRLRGNDAAEICICGICAGMMCFWTERSSIHCCWMDFCLRRNPDKAG